MTDSERRSPDCLDAETLGAYLEARLDDVARARAERHLADCEECYDMFMTQHGGWMAARAPWRQRRTDGHPCSSICYLVAASVTIMLLTLPASRSHLTWPWSGTGRALSELLEATPDRRPSVGRLSASAKWAPAPSATRGTTTDPSASVSDCGGQDSAGLRG